MQLSDMMKMMSQQRQKMIDKKKLINLFSCSPGGRLFISVVHRFEKSG